MLSPFKQKYLSHLLQVEDSIPYPLTRRKMAEIILKYHAIEIKRHKEVQDIKIPKRLQIKHAVYQLVP